MTYIMHSSVNIGLAVAVDGGLLVPNVKDVQDKGLLDIAKGTDDLVARARDNQLMPADMEGGTFTVTNLGMFGVDSFTPIVNPPESCILAVNSMKEKPVVVDGKIEVRTMTTLCLTADHRSVDGADAAKFLARLKELLESPWLLLL
jgi:pyruvate dehydrogenase E2 component (dihydrolipoamide acetyltransferase)